MRVLSLDYGTKHTGVAISDEKQITALHLTTIEAKRDTVLIKEVKRLMQEYDIGLIICGLPSRPRGEYSPMAKKVQDFIPKLAKGTGLEVITWNEEYTSKLAQDRFSKKDKRIHSEAARIILQEYLNYAQENIQKEK